MEVVARFLGDDRDHAGRRVLAEQGRLRAAQHFDALDVGKVADLGHRAAAIDAVDEHRDRRFQTQVVAAGAEPADREAGGKRALVGADLERGNDARQVGDVADLGALDGGGAGHADGDRGVLKGLFALGRRNNDFVAFFGGGIGFIGRSSGLRFFLGVRYSRQGEGGGRNAGQQSNTERTGGTGDNRLHSGDPLSWIRKLLRSQGSARHSADRATARSLVPTRPTLNCRSKPNAISLLAVAIGAQSAPLPKARA